MAAGSRAGPGRVATERRAWAWQKLPGRAGRWAGRQAGRQGRQAGRQTAVQLGGWLPQMAFPDGSKFKRPQGFHNPGNGLSKKRRWGREGLAKLFQGPSPWACAPSPHILEGGRATVSGHGQVPEQETCSPYRRSGLAPYPPAETPITVDCPPLPQ